MTSGADRPFLGAYALVAGMPPTAGRETFRLLADLPIAGLELPLAAASAPATWWDEHVLPSWDLVVTAIPTVMQRLGEDPRYGLASTDEGGRRAALDDVAEAARLAQQLAQQAGRVRVRAVQVNSAPTTLASPDALARSIEQIAAFDLAGALVTIEHCDAAESTRVPQKGFLSLEHELAVLAGGPARLTVNWGRSAIDGRSASTPAEHVRAAVDAGLLGGVMFSGATDQVTAWGRPWDDTHIPPAGDDPALAASSASLLDRAQVDATLAATTGTARYIGVKVTTHPDATRPEQRVAVARAALAMLGQRAQPDGR
ncbi:DUF4862 family protein [Cellulomonas sp. Root137]|uniref:DUF4862 family protein n=1 Tax=Cellulomonas sp. Root137 TaxID=1736459 RepID=UPI0006F9B462|nr:DUF4862 family protein [Cellulomonas sp. Root137]KQY42872.1 hypothetical protein ASD18_17970 [Cellulomonas sp. Root137]KRD43052.1 hypothetical protein ASE38_01865 [Cellulomonas sp. Root930]